MDSQTNFAAGKCEQETRWWEGNSCKGKVEAPPDVLFVPRRESDVPAHVSAMGDMLRKQHAVRQSYPAQDWLVIGDEISWKDISRTIFGERDFVAVGKVSEWNRRTATRTGRLLLCSVRTSLG